MARRGNRSEADAAENNQKSAADPLLKQFIDMFSSCDVWPAVPSGGDVRAILDNTMADVYAQKGSMKDGCAEAERELQRIHDEYVAHTRR